MLCEGMNAFRTPDLWVALSSSKPSNWNAKKGEELLGLYGVVSLSLPPRLYNRADAYTEPRC